MLETEAAFHAAMPDVNGQCPARAPPYRYYWVQVFRLWNGKADSNHRYTLDRSVRDTMRARGWVSEGYGPDGVALCTLLAFDEF